MKSERESTVDMERKEGRGFKAGLLCYPCMVTDGLEGMACVMCAPLLSPHPVKHTLFALWFLLCTAPSRSLSVYATVNTELTAHRWCSDTALRCATVHTQKQKHAQNAHSSTTTSTTTTTTTNVFSLIRDKIVTYLLVP